MSLFDGNRTHQQIVDDYNKDHFQSEIDLDTVKDYQDNLESMSLLKKSKFDTNLMLVEKMKEMRQSQLLSKKGSIMYKRFPIVDPDKFFDKIIPKIMWFWSRPFFIFSFLCYIDEF